MCRWRCKKSYYYEGDPTTGLPIFDVDECSDDGLFGGEAGFAPRPEELQADSETYFIIFSEISIVYRRSSCHLRTPTRLKPHDNK
jgi:hypothetical protein